MLHFLGRIVYFQAQATGLALPASAEWNSGGVAFASEAAGISPLTLVCLRPAGSTQGGGSIFCAK
jgi:hypothetical protein